MDRLGLVPTMPGSGPLWTSEGKADVEDAATLVACVTTGSGERSIGCVYTAAALAALATNQMADLMIQGKVKTETSRARITRSHRLSS